MGLLAVSVLTALLTCAAVLARAFSDPISVSVPGHLVTLTWYGPFEGPPPDCHWEMPVSYQDRHPILRYWATEIYPTLGHAGGKWVIR